MEMTREQNFFVLICKAYLKAAKELDADRFDRLVIDARVNCVDKDDMFNCRDFEKVGEFETRELSRLWDFVKDADNFDCEFNKLYKDENEGFESTNIGVAKESGDGQEMFIYG